MTMIDDLQGGREQKKNIDIIPAFLGFLTLIGLDMIPTILKG